MYIVFGKGAPWGKGFDDFTAGTAEHDWIHGGWGNDTLRGGGGDDWVNGWYGNDALYGDAGSDTLDGGEGDDYLEPGAGNALLVGGGGADVFYVGGLVPGDRAVVKDYRPWENDRLVIDGQAMVTGFGFDNMTGAWNVTVTGWSGDPWG